ncbi:MAG: GNAT family N-acetyltransferase, partial [Bacteroidetes bacterium]
MNFRLAQPSDDGPIMDLFNHIPVEGSWKIRYMKSPSYLDALKLQGHQTFTLVGEKNGKIMAVVSAVYQKVWVKNLCLTVGYITDVRVYPDHRSGFALRKGIKTMEEISMQQKAHFHYATLIDDNSLTKKVFGANRPG